MAKKKNDNSPPASDTTTAALYYPDTPSTPPATTADYDLSTFYTSASDSKGHSAVFTCRVMPQILTQLEYIIQAHKFPYKDKSSIVRHAIHRHLEWLVSLEPIRSIMGQVQAACQVLGEIEQQSEFSALFEKMSQQISSYLGRNAEGEARRLVMTILRIVRDMPVGYWRDQYEGELNTRWGYLVENGETANLGAGITMEERTENGDYGEDSE